jgi:hypothetical protein
MRNISCASKFFPSFCLPNYFYFVYTSVPIFQKLSHIIFTSSRTVSLQHFVFSEVKQRIYCHFSRDINTLHRCQRPCWSYRSNYTIRGLITDGIPKGATELNILQTGSDRAHQQAAKAEQISCFSCVTNFKRYLVISRTPLVSLQPFVTCNIEVYCNVNQRALNLKITIEGKRLTFYLRQVQHVAKLGQFQTQKDLQLCRTIQSVGVPTRTEHW